jgi:DNA-binding response OmpR family regulator
MSGPRLNLRDVKTLIVDRDHFTASLVGQMLRGFGMEGPAILGTAAAARLYLKSAAPDLILVEAVLPDEPSHELIAWIRHATPEPLRFVPIIVLSGYTQLSAVRAARDAGAHFVVKKPVSPKALFERIAWVARSERPFLETESFAGPDRRFGTKDPPDGAYKRPGDDEKGGAAKTAAPAQSALGKGFAT